MGSEAVIVAEAAGETFELGKFAGTWINDTFSWERCDLVTLTKRVTDALLGTELEYLPDWLHDPDMTEVLALEECAASARRIFEFLECHDWKVEVMSDEDLWDRFEARDIKFRSMGSRYG